MRTPTLADREHHLHQAITTGDPAAIALAAQHLDVTEGLHRRQHQPATLLQAALWYASVGLHVFPLQPRVKIPYRGSRGFEDATTDPDTIARWWTAAPGSNIGIATGHLVDVIDIDGPNGVLSWTQHPDLIPDPIGTVNTPRPGGSHLWIPATGGGNRAGVLPGIDLRGLGGYSIAPPSVLAPHADRDYHGPYTWRRPLDLTAIGGRA